MLVAVCCRCGKTGVVSQHTSDSTGNVAGVVVEECQSRDVQSTAILNPDCVHGFMTNNAITAAFQLPQRVLHTILVIFTTSML